MIEGIKKRDLVYNIKNKKALKQLVKIENKADVFIGKYIIHVRFRDEEKSFNTASLLSSIENKNTGELLDVVFFPIFISNFLDEVKETQI